MARDWYVIIPVWGEDYIQRLADIAMPNLRTAFSHAGIRPNDLIATPTPGDVRDILEDDDWGYVPLDPGLHPERLGKYATFGDAHRLGLDLVPDGCPVLMMCADVVVSVDSISTCESILDRGAKCIASLGPSINLDTPPPVGLPARELMEFAFHHMGWRVLDFECGKGTNPSLSVVYFLGENYWYAHLPPSPNLFS